MLEDCTLVTCSYNTPEVLALCLKSFVCHHGAGPHPIVIIENSSDRETQKMLDANYIPYVINTGGTHSPSVDLGLHLVTSGYALLIDTDVVFMKHVGELLRLFIQNRCTLSGEIQGDRGQFLLYPRVAPYCCFINMKNIRKQKIRFHNEQKIRQTNSKGFFNTIPINTAQKNQRFYDVGSIFYENIQRNHLRIGNIADLPGFVFHAESLSWAMQSGMEEYVHLGKRRQEAFYRIAMKYKEVNIKNCFKGS